MLLKNPGFLMSPTQSCGIPVYFEESIVYNPAMVKPIRKLELFAGEGPIFHTESTRIPHEARLVFYEKNLDLPEDPEIPNPKETLAPAFTGVNNWFSFAAVWDGLSYFCYTSESYTCYVKPVGSGMEAFWSVPFPNISLGMLQYHATIHVRYVH